MDLIGTAISCWDLHKVFFFEYKWKLHKEGFKGYSILSFYLSSPSFSTISFLIPQTFSINSFFLSFLVSKAVIDAFTGLLKLFYKRHSHVSSTKTINLIVCFLCFFFFFCVFLIFRTLVVFLFLVFFFPKISCYNLDSYNSWAVQHYDFWYSDWSQVY